ncbi:MAG: DNA polymerase III subunit beta [Patescibacteria group bacterium]|jgi:DNA polymerase-3 subunit beta
MEIQVSQPQLLKALHTVTGLARPNMQLPVLSNVLLDVGGGSMILKATDLNSGVSQRIDVIGDGSTKMLVSAAQFFEYVQTLLPEPLAISNKAGSLVIEQGGSRASLPLAEADEYPDFSPDQTSKGAEMEATPLLESIKKSMVAVAEDDGRPILTGLLFKRDKKGGLLNIVGTDGYRLSVCAVKYKGEWERDLLVPAKSLNSLLKGVETESVEVGFDSKNNQVWLRAGERSIVLRLLEGDFPDFGRIIPVNHATEVVVDRDAFARAVQQSAVFARQNANVVRIGIEKTLCLSAQGGYIGSSSVEVDAKISGEGLSAAFNYRYLREYLAVLGDGDVSIAFNGPLAPVKFVANSDPTFTHIIMPVKT